MDRRTMLRSGVTGLAVFGALGAARWLEGGVRMAGAMTLARGFGLLPTTGILTGAQLEHLASQAEDVFGNPAPHSGSRLYIPPYSGPVEAWRVFQGANVDLLIRYPSSFTSVPNGAFISTQQPELFPDGFTAAVQFQDEAVVVYDPAQADWLLSAEATQEKAKHEDTLGGPLLVPSDGLRVADNDSQEQCTRLVFVCIVTVAGCHFVMRNVRALSWVCGLSAQSCSTSWVRC